MCFSATASFAASGVLTVTGAATLSHTQKRSEWLLASAPLLFGIQQFAEGVLWLTIGTQSPFLPVAVYVFLFFAFIWWPAVVPLAVYLLEKDRHRKGRVKALMVLGFFVAFILLYHLITQGAMAKIVNHSIQYLPADGRPLPYQPLMTTLYLVAVVGSCLFSSHRFVRIFGLLILLFFFLTIAVFKLTYVSVWCFFAAILSLFLFWHFRKKRRA